MDNPKSNRNGEQSASNENFRLIAPQISLPKGGGAIRGMGEKFAANPVTGTGSLTVPVYASPGRSGFGPQLSLSYDSGAGNGPFGFGWSLALPAITRKTDKGLAAISGCPRIRHLHSVRRRGSDALIGQHRRPMDAGLSHAARQCMANNMRSIVIAREWRVCLPALSAGSICPIRRTRSGAPSPKTTSRPGTARQRRAASPTRTIPVAFSVG